MGKGGEGGIELAKKVLDTLEHKEAHFKPLYEDEMSLMDKIKTIATEIYGADDVTYSKAALKELKHIEEMGMGNFLYVWQRPSILFLMMHQNLADRLALP